MSNEELLATILNGSNISAENADEVLYEILELKNFGISDEQIIKHFQIIEVE